MEEEKGVERGSTVLGDDAHLGSYIVKDVLHQEEVALYSADNWNLVKYFMQDGVLERVC